MNKIFISHNQEFKPARVVKALINMMDGHGILVEDEPGAESPDKKSIKLLKECQGFFALCTADLKSADGFSPKGNVILEMNEWQRIRGAKNLVIAIQTGCKLPVLLGNPTYCGEFEGVEILDVIQRALAEFRTMGLLPSPNPPTMPETAVELTELEEKLLSYLLSCENGSQDVPVVRAVLKCTTAKWNVIFHRLANIYAFIDHYQRYSHMPDSGFIKISKAGIDYIASRQMKK